VSLYDLMPGQVALGKAGDQLKTLLGSCVSVILTDPRRTVGAMCHIVHVGHPNAANHQNTAYGNVAMAEMARLLYTAGFALRSCEAFVAGGGNMFPKLFAHHHVGTTNADWALDYLAHHHIRIVKQDVGGYGYRRLSWTVGPTDPHIELTSSK